jgi:uncharacterized protein (DUF302 family)
VHEPVTAAPLGGSKENHMDYGFGTRVAGSFDEVLPRVQAALKDEGFGVLSDLDIQAAMREKLGVEMRRYRILGACAPALAFKVLQAEPDIGLMLPCNVVVREDDDAAVQVSVIDPARMAQTVDQPAVREVAAEVTQRLQRVLEKLQRSEPSGSGT